MKAAVIHKIDFISYAMGWTARSKCGLYFGQRGKPYIKQNWTKVTCKNCRRTKKQRKTK